MPVLRVTELAASPTDALLAANLGAVQERVRSAAAEAGRDAPTLVMVTKSVDLETTRRLHRAAARAGLQTPDFAENRAPAFRDKADGMDEHGHDVRWHFVGHVQRNKARRVLERADVLHSVDSLRLAETVVRIATELERRVEVFVQAHLTGEDAKHGLAVGELDAAIETLAACEWTPVLGLMAMGPLDGAGVTTDEVFERTASIRADLEGRLTGAFEGGRCRLSMGMSGDLELAVKHGSDYVRVGSALFAGGAQHG